MMEEDQAQAKRANLPINDDVLVVPTKRSMVATNDYPNRTESWNKMAPCEGTWNKWKSTYKESYTAYEHSAII